MHIHSDSCDETVLSTFHAKKILTIEELSELLSCSNITSRRRLKKERHSRDIVYFSSEKEVYEQQKRNRFPPEGAAWELPPDAEAIIILVELIHNPHMSIDELAAGLQNKGHNIEIGSIAALFKKHEIT